MAEKKGKYDPIEVKEKRLEELKKQGNYKHVYLISVPADDSGQNWYHCYIKSPNRATLGKVVSDLTQGRILEAAEIILNSCWIEGDEQIRTEDELFLSAAMKISDIVKVREAVVKKS